MALKAENITFDCTDPEKLADRWARALDGAGRRAAARHYHVGAPGSRADLLDLDDVWTRRYGIAEDGAVLVRPDGHVCWRAFDAPEAHAGVGLAQALDVAVGRSPGGARR